MRRAASSAAAGSRPESAHSWLEYVSHTLGLQGYAESGWWAGVPREKAGI